MSAPTPAMFAAKRPSQLAAAKVIDTRCGARHPNGATCTRRLDRCTGMHIDYHANVTWTDEALAARSRLESGQS